MHRPDLFKTNNGKQIQLLADFNQTPEPYAEVGITTLIYSRHYFGEPNKSVSDKDILEVCGLEPRYDDRMGQSQSGEVKVKRTGMLIIVTQTWQHNC